MMLELVEPKSQATLKVVGVGGAGGNAVNGMVQGGLSGVEFVGMNSDAQVLDQSLATVKVRLGNSTTQGLGCGGRPEVGRQAAEESVEEIRESVRGADMVFVTAGMGGGTGTGASPVVARIAREEGALAVAVVTKPFSFEGTQRARQAEEGLSALRDEVDTLIVIPNQRLLTVTDKMTTLLDAFRRADEVLFHATRGISDLITVPGLINLDFADVKAVMSARGNALMGTGYAQGGTSAEEAARMAISSPLLEDVSISGAEAVPHRERGHEHHQRCGGRRRQRHLRGGHRPRDGGRGPHHRDRYRFRPGGVRGARNGETPSARQARLGSDGAPSHRRAGSPGRDEPGPGQGSLGEGTGTRKAGGSGVYPEANGLMRP
jgi:cell division protein FtsZ